METAYRSTMGRSADDDVCVSPNIRVRGDCGRVPTKNGISRRNGRASARVRFNGFVRSESFVDSLCVWVGVACMSEGTTCVPASFRSVLQFDFFYSIFVSFNFWYVFVTFFLFHFLSSISPFRFVGRTAYIVRYVWIDGCEQTSERERKKSERETRMVRARSYERRGTTKQTRHEWSDRMVYWYHVHAQRTSFFYLLIELVHLISPPSRRRLRLRGEHT